MAEIYFNFSVEECLDYYLQFEQCKIFLLTTYGSYDGENWDRDKIKTAILSTLRQEIQMADRGIIPCHSKRQKDLLRIKEVNEFTFRGYTLNFNDEGPVSEEFDIVVKCPLGTKPVTVTVKNNIS